MKLTYEDSTKENWFLVSWVLSNKCNYRCSYCPSHLHSGTTGQPKWDVVSTFIKNFKVPNKQICFRVSGGEPTHWKYFSKMAALIKEQGHIFSFMSNGSQPIEYYKNISKYTNGLILSYHPEKSSVDHFIKIANNVTCPIAVNLMLMPENFDDIVEIAKLLYNGTNNMLIWPKVILDKSAADGYITNEVSYYTPEQQELINNWPYSRKIDDSKLHRGNMLLNGKKITANDLILNGLNAHDGWKCWAGIDGVNIDMWGKLYRADCQYGGPIGDLTSYTLPSEPIICGKDICGCLSDIYLRKETT